jgi:hypothetical protein
MMNGKAQTITFNAISNKTIDDLRARMVLRALPSNADPARPT